MKARNQHTALTLHTLFMAVSKAFLRRLYYVIKDRDELSAIRRFLSENGDEIMASRLRIINGKLRYKGSIGPVTFYTWQGKHKARKKSCLDAKRFKKDPAFKGSRESAQRFGAGNKLASRLYQLVEAEKRKYTLFCFLKKSAIELLKEGRQVEEVREVLLDYLKSFSLVKLQQQEQQKPQIEKHRQR